MKKILLVTLFFLFSIGSAQAATLFSSKISSSTDDAEERLSSGSMRLTSSDLELVRDGSNDQIVGMRFNNIDIPQGAHIVSAYIQFTVDETKGSDAGAVLNINAQAADNPPGFSTANSNISNRALTSASVQWDVPAWNSTGYAGSDQQTPDISEVIQEVINRPNWIIRNSIVVIVTGSGTRTAESFNGSSAQAPLLVTEYSIGPPVYECSDGQDNDSDDLTDYPADPGCTDANDDNELGSNECDDGIDNDGDGSIDFQEDSGCTGIGGIDESNCGDAACEGQETWQNCIPDCPVPQCSDGIDNDGDGLIDFNQDPECLDANDNYETENPTGAWKFAVLGDTRSGYSEHSENVIGIVNKMPNGERVTVLNTGDINADGEVSQWEDWSVINAPLAIDPTKVTPPDYIGAVGNHDTHVSGWLTNWINYLPAQRGLTAYPTITGDNDGRYGSVKYDNTLFIWVDSDTTPAGQEPFLENTLISASQDSDVKWIFVFFHHPPVPCGSKSDWGTGQDWHDNYFVPYGVDIVFLGHAHYYERTCPFTTANAKICDEGNRGNVIGDSDGVIHVITGGGGAGTYSTGDCAWLESEAGSHHFLEMEVNGDILKLKAWDTDGGGANPSLIDELTIDKTPINPVYQCSDGLDNDGDGSSDFPNDPGCLSETDDSELGSNECDDGIDNDGDGLMDYPADLGCTQASGGDESNCGDLVCEGVESWLNCSDCPAPQCSDNIDNDGDGLIDHQQDPGCLSATDDSELGSNECDDGIDNDGDGAIDYPADSGCTEAGGGDESNCGDSVCEGVESWPGCTDCPAPQCSDGTDNDGDGLIDHQEDPGCLSATDDSELGSNECDDGIDNDGDGLIDYPADPGCTGAGGNDESNCGDSVCEGAETLQSCPEDCSMPQCSDGTDNDGDGLVDFPADPGCADGNDDNEYNPVSPTEISVRVSSSTDDAEEKASGSVGLSSSDLEMVYDRSDQQVGMRFTGIDIPQGATIVNAYIQFKVDETPSGATYLTIQGQAIDNAPTFTSSSANISSRAKTTAAVSWEPAPWPNRGAAGPDQQTPDIAAVVQEIVSLPDWTSGNSLVIIITGTGERVAESYNGDRSGAPLLHVGYTTGPPNNPPTANDDSAGTTEDNQATIDVAQNDTDPDDNLNPDSANEISAPSNGTVTPNGNGSCTYTPNPDFHGTDSFVYEICDTQNACDTATVTITVAAVADSPVASDDSAGTQEETLVTIDVAANDNDPDGDLDLASTTNNCGGCTDPANGILVNNSDGTFDYTPNSSHIGPDSFVYEICDTLGACDMAQVSITVTETNDPPVANDDTASTSEDTPKPFNVAANDTDPDGNLYPNSASIAANPANGSVVNNGDGNFTYTPNTNFNGSDSFVYEICDTPGLCDTATVSITVDNINDPPVANDDSVGTLEDTQVTIDVAANDTDPEGNLDPSSANTDCLESACSYPANGYLASNYDGTFAYTPDSGFNGSDNFVYQICDLEDACDTATVNITVQPSAVSVDTISSGTTAGSNLTISHTTSGTNRLMLVGVSINNDNYETVSAITYNGVALSYVNSETQSDDARVEIWQLVAPPVGTYDLAITFSADLRRYAVAGVTTFTGVDQTDPLGTFAGNNATTNSANVTISSGPGELVLGVFSCETCDSITFAFPAGEEWNVIAGGGNEIGAGSTMAGESPQVTIDASLGARDHWALGGISIKPGS